MRLKPYKAVMALVAKTIQKKKITRMCMMVPVSLGPRITLSGNNNEQWYARH